MADVENVVKYIPIDRLTKWHINPRTITDKALNDLKYKINKYKFFMEARPILVNISNDKPNELIVFAGNQRLEATKQLGWKEVPVIIFHNLTTKEQKELAIIDNHNDGEWNMETLQLHFNDIEFNSLGLELNFKVQNNIELPTNNIASLQQGETEEIIEDNDGFAQNPNYLDRTRPGTIRDIFVQCPFSILDCKQKRWIERKEYWWGLYEDGRNRALKAKGPLAKALNCSSKFGVSVIDPVLCEIVCKWFTPCEKANIFDCFAGDTGFGFVSSYLGHNFTGIELRREQCEENSKQCANNEGHATYFCDDGRNLDKYIEDESQDLFFSCPPYFDLEKYSDKENDLSNMSYDNFIKAFETAFAKAIKALKNNRFAIVVMSDVRDKKNGGYYTICDEIRRIFKENGCCVYNELILATQLASAPFKARRSMLSRKMVRVHQEVLCFYKGNPLEVKNHFKSLSNDYIAPDGIVNEYGEECTDGEQEIIE